MVIWLRDQEAESDEKYVDSTFEVLAVAPHISTVWEILLGFSLTPDHKYYGRQGQNKVACDKAHQNCAHECLNHRNNKID